MRAVQITRFGGPEVLDVVDLPDPTPGDGEQLYEVRSAGVNYADTPTGCLGTYMSVSPRSGRCDPRSDAPEANEKSRARAMVSDPR
jgi:hypothetical protein